MPTRPKLYRPKHWKTPAERRRAFDRGRGNSAARLYDRRWRKARAAYLARYPLCAGCRAQGVVTPATEVDHVVPHRGDARRFWDPDNWQPLCKPHHSAKTAREVGWGGAVGYLTPVPR